MTGHQMQVLIDGEWQDVASVSDFEFTPEAETDVEEPAAIPTTFTMTAQVNPEDIRALFDRFGELERKEQIEQIDRARRRMWLRFPYPMGGVR